MIAGREAKLGDFLAVGTRDKVLLLWSNKVATRLRQVSINILREICEYLEGEQTKVAALCQGTLRVLDVMKNTVRKFTLTREFTIGAVYCFLEINTLLCAGGWPEETSAFLINSATGVLTPLAPMGTARAWPGVYAGKTAAYLFGGNNPSICSSEKLVIRSKEWAEVENMKYPRYSFSPCHFEGKLYLADFLAGHRVMEIFDLHKETFSESPIPIPSEAAANSVGFVLEDEIVILCDGAGVSRARWHVNKEPAMRVDSLSGSTARPYSPCPPLCFKEKVYFSNFESGKLACYDPAAGRLDEVLDVQEEEWQARDNDS